MLTNTHINIGRPIVIDGPNSSERRDANVERRGRAGANALTIDVEDWYHVAAFKSAIPKHSWPTLEDRVVANTEAILDFLESSGVRATFFVLGLVAERHPGLVRQISSLGHEVACHGYSHEFVYRQSIDQFREETRRAKCIIESATGNRIRGYRASTYSITKRSLWALDVLLDEGFEYDSSIFPIHHPQYGIPGAERIPGQILTPCGSTILEFPITTCQVAGVTVPVGGGGYFRFFPYRLSRALLRHSIKASGQPFIFYMHPWEIDPGQPRVANASIVSRLRHYTNIPRFMGRLGKLLDDFEFSTVENVLRQTGLLATSAPPKSSRTSNLDAERAVEGSKSDTARSPT